MAEAYPPRTGAGPSILPVITEYTERCSHLARDGHGAMCNFPRPPKKRIIDAIAFTNEPAFVRLMLAFNRASYFENCASLDGFLNERRFKILWNTSGPVG
jgi:hypothetical protein